ncbi:Ig-like domain-containing protein [Bacillus sp. AFS037270]|uniref:Ig-like domain-containing protein n=1 Tax=Bacillus sp. AFS037270 TaxID=2033499 RepID=UPI000BFE9E2F|nr:Ig-like domain-containing protein [Bacillus sp. AFS037270]PGV51540.1 mannosyl-glycoendo-beta-N-acetylglucosaminidase [Bacillus sp. AFS037270]
MTIIKSKLTEYLLAASFLTILLIFHSSNALAAGAVLTPKGYIDAPATGATLKGISVVKGWFLDGSGVSKVEVLVDGKTIGQAQYGSSRTDVGIAYPAYQNANAGYQYSLNTANLLNGQHTLTVRETGKNGAMTELKRIVNVQNAVQNTVQNTVQNLPAKGTIDDPKNGATVKDSTLVRGWFLDGSGVSKVEVLVDGKSVGQAQYGLSRTDVSRAYPAYKNANAGYQYTLNTKNLSNGQHTLTVSETGKSGAKKEVKSLFTVQNTVQTLPVRGTIDAPVNGATVKGTTLVRGWFLDGSGVAKVEVLVDGKLLAQAQYGLSRTDVARVYPAYKNTNAGYQYTLDTTNLSNGQHTLTVRETGKSGAKLELKRLITVQNTVVNIVTRGVIDEPKNGSTVSGSTLVRGWFLDGSGVSKVEVLVDGKSVGQAQYGLSRTDVSNAYPAYKNDNSGYQYALNTVNLTNGQHTLTVRETGKNGAIKELKSLFSVLNLPVRGSLESPKNGVTIEGNTLVSGWFLDQSGVSKVEVLVDGIVIGEAKYGVSRSDINQAYPDYQNVNAGFQYTLNPENLTPGQHTLTVRETGKNGLKTELQSQFNIQGLPSKGSLDSPNSGTVLKGKAIVSGWFLDGSGVNRIEVLVDGSLMGEADYGLARTDVQSVYPEYKNANSGFQYTLNTLQLKDGEHTLSVKETGINGETSTITTQITVGNGNLYTILNLKKPSTITASEIVAFFDKKNPTSPLKSYAQSFINAQIMYGVNALYLLAHTIWETGWGGSDLITYKHNLYGYGAYDVCPFTCGYYFPTVQDSINKVAYQVRHDYLDESGAYYNSSYGPTLTGMNVRYATDQNWKNGIANLMESMKPYDSSYYWNLPELNVTASAPPTYGRDIPDGQLYPTDTIINFPSGIVAKVNTSSVNLRSLPYLSTSTIIGSLNFNTVVSMVGYNTDVYYDPTSTNYDGYRWYRVAANGQNGWLNGQNVTIGNLLQVDSDADNLLVRSSASTSSTILTYVDSETYLKAVTNTNGDVVSQNGWYNVYLPNSTSTGWVSGEFVSQITH